jgi:hypothetical protein
MRGAVSHLERGSGARDSGGSFGPRGRGRADGPRVQRRRVREQFFIFSRTPNPLGSSIPVDTIFHHRGRLTALWNKATLNP